MRGGAADVVLEALQAVPSAAGAGLIGRVGEELEGLRTLAVGLGGAAAAAASSMCWNTAGSWVPSAPLRNWRAMSTALTVPTALMRWSLAAALSA